MLRTQTEILSEIMNHLKEWLEDEHRIVASVTTEVEMLDIDRDDLDIHVHLRFCLPLKLKEKDESDFGT